MKVWFIPNSKIDWERLNDQDVDGFGSEVADYVIPGMLTTDHPASSYGLPVLVDEDGNAYGAAEVYEGSWSGEPGEPRDTFLEARAAAAGYHLETNYGHTATTY